MHINKRVKSRPKVQLPMDDLLVQYQDANTPAFVAVSFADTKFNCSESSLLRNYFLNNFFEMFELIIAD